MDQNSRENLVRLRKRSILQNQKASISLEEFWTTEATLREYFYDLPGPQSVSYTHLTLPTIYSV